MNSSGGGASMPPPTSTPSGTATTTMGTTTATTTATTATTTPAEPTSWFLRACFALNVATAIASALSAFVFIVEIFREQTAVVDVGVKLFAAGLCVVSVAAEMEEPRFFAVFPVLESWVARGLLVAFEGMLLLHFHAVEFKQDDFYVASFVVQVAGTLSFVAGMVYVVGGAACIKRIKDVQVQKMRRKEQMRRDKLDLEARKQEIETLLHEAEARLERM